MLAALKKQKPGSKQLGLLFAQSEGVGLGSAKSFHQSDSHYPVRNIYLADYLGQCGQQDFATGPRNHIHVITAGGNNFPNEAQILSILCKNPHVEQLIVKILVLRQSRGSVCQSA